MPRSIVTAFALCAATIAFPAYATGLATCDSGPTAGWQPQAKLEKQLIEKKW